MKRVQLIGILLLTLASGIHQTAAQGTAFTYQGVLTRITCTCAKAADDCCVAGRASVLDCGSRLPLLPAPER